MLGFVNHKRQKLSWMLTFFFFFFIKTRSFCDIVLCFKKYMAYVHSFFLELRDRDYPAANHFPNVNCILSRRNVCECKVIVFFQPLQAKQWLTWVGTCEAKYCFYLSELAIMDQERNIRTNWDLMPRWYFPRLSLMWANGKKLNYIYP